MINVSHSVAFLRSSALTQYKTPESAFALVLCVPAEQCTLVLAIGVKSWRKMRVEKCPSNCQAFRCGHSEGERVGNKLQNGYDKLTGHERQSRIFKMHKTGLAAASAATGVETGERQKLKAQTTPATSSDTE